MTPRPTAHSIEEAKEAIEALEDIYDLSDTANVEVLLDAAASALSKIKKPRSSTTSLAGILALFVEDNLADPIAITLCDEITEVIEFKDYEGFSDEYVAEKIGSLMPELHEALQNTIRKLRAQTDR